MKKITNHALRAAFTSFNAHIRGLGLKPYTFMDFDGGGKKKYRLETADGEKFIKDDLYRGEIYSALRAVNILVVKLIKAGKIKSKQKIMDEVI